MRRIAALSALFLVGGLLGPSAALADQNGEPGEDKNRWITVEDNFAVVLPNGDTFSEGNAPPEMVQPPVGTRLFISEVVYDRQTAPRVVPRWVARTSSAPHRWSDRPSCATPPWSSTTARS
jgi:hypothetical protein